MDHDKSNHTETCQICKIELNNESNQCTNPKAFKKVLSDGQVVCLACCDALILRKIVNHHHQLKVNHNLFQKKW